MKKIASVFLSVTLVLTLLCPVIALADELDDEELGFEDRYPDLTPWELRGFDDVDDYVDWVLSRTWVRITVNTQFWEALGATSLESLFAWYEWQRVSEEEYRILEEAWSRAVARFLSRREDELVERGGTRGIVNVMYNGTFLRFPNAAPIVVDGRAFVPAGPYFEAMGATLSFDELTGELTAVLKDRTVVLAIGQDMMIVSADGRTRERPIGAEPYVAGGEAYIPIGAVAWHLGQSALWDRTHGAVVIIDTQRIIEEVDAHFTIINSLFDMPFDFAPANSGVRRTVIDILMSYTQFNSLDGDANANMGMQATVLSDGRSLNMSGTINLSELIDLLLAEYNDMYEAYYADDDYVADEIASLTEMLNMLGNLAAELIYDGNMGVLYVRTPLLSQLIPVFPADAWISISGMDGFEEAFSIEDILFELGYSNVTAGGSIGAMIVPDYTSFSFFRGTGMLDIYDEIMEAVAFNKALFGDSAFVRRGDVYSISLSQAEVNEAARVFNQPVRYTEYDMDIAVRRSGGVTTGATGSIVYRERGLARYDTRQTIAFDIGPDRFSFSLEEHVRNERRVFVDISVATASVNVPVPTAPPPGDTVIPLDDLFGFGFPFDLDQLMPMANMP